MSSYIPENYNFINYNKAYDNLFYLFKSYMLLNVRTFENTKHIKEGIENRIYKVLKESSNYQEFISKMKLKDIKKLY